MQDNSPTDDDCIVFEVEADGTLLRAGFSDTVTHADLYGYLTEGWSASPTALATAMHDCEQLAWAVEQLYDTARNQLIRRIEAATATGELGARGLNALKTSLSKLPEDPSEGAPIWAASLDAAQFEQLVVPALTEWFAEAADWTDDEDLPDLGTAEGAALQYFRSMDFDAIARLGIDLVEGEHPGSNYYAAVLRTDIDTANEAARSAGIPVRFVEA